MCISTISILVGRIDGLALDKRHARTSSGDADICESKVVKGSEPFGLTVDAEGDPWYTMMAANKIGEFQSR